MIGVDKTHPLAAIARLVAAVSASRQGSEVSHSAGLLVNEFFDPRFDATDLAAIAYKLSSKLWP
jgi:hypothetical protein